MRPYIMGILTSTAIYAAHEIPTVLTFDMMRDMCNSAGLGLTYSMQKIPWYWRPVPFLLREIKQRREMVEYFRPYPVAYSICLYEYCQSVLRCYDLLLIERRNALIKSKIGCGFVSWVRSRLVIRENNYYMRALEREKPMLERYVTILICMSHTMKCAEVNHALLVLKQKEESDTTPAPSKSTQSTPIL